MDDISSIRDLVNLWPTRAALAADLRSVWPSLRVTTAQVHKWAEKNSIPSKYQSAVLMAASARDFPISAARLVELNAPERSAA